MPKVSWQTTEKFFKAVKRNGGIECSQYPNLFVPEDLLAHAVAEDYKFLRQVCKRCPVIDLCADYAIELAPTHGMWAGMTPQEIAKKHKERFGNAKTGRDSELDDSIIESRDGEGQAEEDWGESDFRPLHVPLGDGADWEAGSEDEILAWGQDWDGDPLAA
jgi:WhiB family redox-sensing transcriptional regulator